MTLIEEEQFNSYLSPLASDILTKDLRVFYQMMKNRKSIADSE